MKLSDFILGTVYSNIIYVVTMLVCMGLVMNACFSHSDYSNDELLVMEIIVPVACVLVTAVSVAMMRKYVKQGEEPYENVDKRLYFSLGLSILLTVVGVLDYAGVI